MSRQPPRGRSRIGTSSSSRLNDWLAALIAAPGLTALRDPAAARAMLLDDALRALELVRGLEGPIIDVGSGGGSPGIPLAFELPDRELTLLEAERRKCDFLERWAPPNAAVVWGRAELQEPDSYGVALAKALGRPPVAAEWTLPLVRPGGSVVLWVGPTADLGAVATVSELLGGAPPDVHDNGLVVLRKLTPTPPGFPRRVGVARKRPLA